MLALDVSALVAGTSYRGELESRLRALLAELEAAAAAAAPDGSPGGGGGGAGGALLFIDEIHALAGAGGGAGAGAGGAEGGLDVVGMLKPALARGRLGCIGAAR